MAAKRRNNKRKPNRRRNRYKAIARPSIPTALVRGAKLMRSIQLYVRIDETSWLDNLLYFGMYALKLYLADYTPIQENKIPVGSLQSMTITLDDLLVGTAFSRNSVNGEGPDQWRCQFVKGKLHALGIKLVSTAAPSKRAGRMGLSFIWFNEAEALEAVDDLKHKQTAVLPDLKRFFQSPGVSVAPVSSGITKTWIPPVGSWVRDYIRIGKSTGEGSESAWGLPVGRVIVGYQNLDANKQSESYLSEDSSLMLDFTATVNLAELGDRALRKELNTEYDAKKFGVYSQNGFYEVASETLVRQGGILIPKVPSSRGSSPAVFIASEMDRLSFSVTP